MSYFIKQKDLKEHSSAVYFNNHISMLVVSTKQISGVNLVESNTKGEYKKGRNLYRRLKQQNDYYKFCCVLSK